MVQITEIKQKGYLIMDAILIILCKKGQLDIVDLRYELLKCGIMIQTLLLRKALNELNEHGAVDDVG